MRSFTTLLFAKYNEIDEVKEYQVGRAGSTTGERRNACRMLMGKPEGKGPLGRSSRRYADNIKMDLREVGWGGVDRIGVAQDRDQWRALVNMIINLRRSTKYWQVLE
jgi:hypothetical protein